MCPLGSHPLIGGVIEQREKYSFAKAPFHVSASLLIFEGCAPQPAYETGKAFSQKITPFFWRDTG
jgi:hypothetical protein